MEPINKPLISLKRKEPPNNEILIPFKKPRTEWIYINSETLENQEFFFAHRSDGLIYNHFDIELPNLNQKITRIDIEGSRIPIANDNHLVVSCNHGEIPLVAHFKSEKQEPGRIRFELGIDTTYDLPLYFEFRFFTSEHEFYIPMKKVNRKKKQYIIAKSVWNILFTKKK